MADLPSILTLHRPDGSTQILPQVEVPPFAFHRSVVACLTQGTPMDVSAAQSRDVVALMEAAEESARDNGRPVTPSLLR